MRMMTNTTVCACVCTPEAVLVHSVCVHAAMPASVMAVTGVVSPNTIAWTPRQNVTRQACLFYLSQPSFGSLSPHSFLFAERDVMTWTSDRAGA